MRIELRLERSVIEARSDAHFQSAENGRIDARLDHRILAQGGSQRGGHVGALRLAQRNGGHHLGGDDAAAGLRQAAKGVDDLAGRGGAPIGTKDAEEPAGSLAEAGAGGERVERPGAVLPGHRGRGQEQAQIDAGGGHRLQRRQVGLDRAQRVRFGRVVEERPRIARADIAGSGIVRQVKTVRVSWSRRFRTRVQNRHKGLNTPKNAAGSGSRNSPLAEAARLIPWAVSRRNQGKTSR